MRNNKLQEGEEHHQAAHSPKANKGIRDRQNKAMKS
jgi:hypothetical protein